MSDKTFVKKSVAVLLLVFALVAFDVHNNYAFAKYAKLTGAAVSPTDLTNVEIKSGWNIIGIDTLQNLTSTSCSRGQIKDVVWAWYPQVNAYGKYKLSSDMKSFESAGDEKSDNNRALYRGTLTGTRAVWLFNTGEACTMSSDAKWATTTGFTIPKGWNMIGVQLGWVGKSISDLTGGSCSFESGLYFFNAGSYANPSIPVSTTDKFQEHHVGQGFWIAAKEGCTIKASVRAKEPPVTGDLDLDAAYIRRTPEYLWDAAKNWPDVGEKITFTAHVINKGNIAAFDVEYEWKLYDLSNNLVAEDEGIFPKIVAGEDVTAALDWNWQDGPYKLVFVVDPANKVQELFENNNKLEEFTNSYLVAFKVEKTLYDWFNSKESCKDVPDSYFVWADGSVKPGYRCGTKSWEDWAQRQIRQFNEFLVKAEDEHLGKMRHSLPRLKLQRVDVIDDNYMYNRGGVFYHNCPFDYVPERKYYDSSWGFEKTAWAQPGTPESIDGYAKNPEWLVVERALIHELGHTFNRPHLDVGKLENGQVEIKDESGNFVFSQEGVVYLCDEKICVDDIITNPGSSKGFSKYTAIGLKYQLGYSDKARKVPVRIGHRNGCEGYGNDYPEILKSELQLPKSNKLKVVGINGNPVPNVDVSIYLSQPQQDFMPFVDGVPDLKGKTDSNGIFDLGPYPLAPPGAKYPRIGRSFVIKISQVDFDQYRFLDVMHMNLELWKGNNDAVYLADVTALGKHNNIIAATNLVLGEKADASINSGLAANANEGDTSNPAKFWEPANGEGKAGDWWEVELARLSTLHGIVLYSYAGNYHDWYSRFHIDVSQDRKTWKTVATEEDWDKSRSGKQAVSYTFNPQQGKFVRIISDTNQNYVKLQEAEVYGFTNLALGEKANASINSGLAANANEGDTSNPAKFWEPANGEGKAGDWWEVELARLSTLHGIVLYSYAGNYHDWYSRFHIDVSQDRKTWKTVATEEDWDKSRSGKQAVSYTFNPQQGKFVRIISDTNQNYVKLQEAEVYGVT